MKRAYDALVLTCEHGGNVVPKAYAGLFRGAEKTLETHRGYDLGALEVARGLAKVLKVPLHFATTTRLLIDLNRSLHLRGVWSKVTAELGELDRARIVERYYTPYRSAVERRLGLLLSGRKRVLHLSIHSFTPELDGEIRNAEIGVLYDPRRAYEARLARRLAVAVAAESGAKVRRNYPYVGYSDGFTTHLRRLFPANRYAGIELETRQDELATAAARRRYVDLYATALRSL